MHEWMKVLLKGHCHSKCNCLHTLSKEQEKEFSKFLTNVHESIKQDKDFQQGAAEVEP